VKTSAIFELRTWAGYADDRQTKKRSFVGRWRVSDPDPGERRSPGVSARQSVR